MIARVVPMSLISMEMKKSFVGFASIIQFSALGISAPLVTSEASADRFPSVRGQCIWRLPLPEAEGQNFRSGGTRATSSDESGTNRERSEVLPPREP